MLFMRESDITSSSHAATILVKYTDSQPFFNSSLLIFIESLIPFDSEPILSDLYFCLCSAAALTFTDSGVGTGQLYLDHRKINDNLKTKRKVEP